MDADTLIIIATIAVSVVAAVALWRTYRSLPRPPEPATDEEINKVFSRPTKLFEARD